MTIVVLLVIVAVVGAVAVVLAGRTGGQSEFEPDRPRFELPEGPLNRSDIDGVRFAVGVRGYRMDQVDLVVDRLAAELDDRDREIAELRGGDAAPAVPSPAAPATETDLPVAPEVTDADGRG